MARPKLPGLPAKIRESIFAILDYSEDDESADYEAEGKPEGHVYEHMERVRAWLEGR